MKILDISQQQLAGLREKGLKGMRTGHGKWAFLVEDVVDFLKANIEQKNEGFETLKKDA